VQRPFVPRSLPFRDSVSRFARFRRDCRAESRCRATHRSQLLASCLFYQLQPLQPYCASEVFRNLNGRES
jgi:hypothetical protein